MYSLLLRAFKGATMHFSHTINGVKSWVDIYQSIEAFEPLIKVIFTHHGLRYSKIENLTPGSNAVFRVDDFVIKIFSPIEAGLNTDKVFHIEKAALEHVNNLILSPNLLYSGSIDDKYTFQYIIMNHINAQSFIEKKKRYITIDKRCFATSIKEITNRINVPIENTIIPTITKKDCFENSRWNNFPKSFCEERVAIIKKMSFVNPVYVHSDLKASNVMIGENEEIYLIDFADSHIAPASYEWPFIVFGLFGCDKEMMEAYFTTNYQNESFYIQLTYALLMHKFGAFILMQICELTKTATDAIVNVEILYQLIIQCLQNGNILIS